MRRLLLLLPLVLLPFPLACSGVDHSPLASAVGNGDLPEVRRLLTVGANPNAPVAGFQMSPLGIAAQNGRIDVAEALLEAGALPDAPSGINDWPPLVQAVHVEQEEMVRFLLARTHPSPATRAQALRMAAAYGLPGVVRALLDAGASASADALAGAVGGSWDIDAEWKGCGPHTEAVRTLLAAQPDLRMPDSFSGRAALRFARKKGCTEMLALVEGEVVAGR